MKCLQALAAQTRSADRVIAVDNRSTDASAEVARAYGADLFEEDVTGIWPAAACGYDEAPRRHRHHRADRRRFPPAPRLDRAGRRCPFVADPTLGVLTGGAEFYEAGPVASYIG